MLQRISSHEELVSLSGGNAFLRWDIPSPLTATAFRLGAALALPPVLGPMHFELHTCPGTPVALRDRAGRDDLEAPVECGFRPDNADPGGRIVLDFALVDWVEEDQPVMGHAHDPYKRIDVLHSHRHVVVSLGGGEQGQDIGWFYPEPLDDAVRLRDHVAFWSERCSVTVDGERVTGGMPEAERPTQGSCDLP